MWPCNWAAWGPAPAIMYKHNTEVGEDGKRFLLTGLPIWGSWGLTCSKPFSSAIHRNPLVSKKTEVQTQAQQCPIVPYLSFWSPWRLHEWVLSLQLSGALSLWGAHLWVPESPSSRTAFSFPRFGVHCQIAPASCAGEAPSVGPQCPKLLAPLGARNLTSMCVCVLLSGPKLQGPTGVLHTPPHPTSPHRDQGWERERALLCASSCN